MQAWLCGPKGGRCRSRQLEKRCASAISWLFVVNLAARLTSRPWQVPFASCAVWARSSARGQRISWPCVNNPPPHQQRRAGGRRSVSPLDVQRLESLNCGRARVNCPQILQTGSPAESWPAPRSLRAHPSEFIRAELTPLTMRSPPPPHVPSRGISLRDVTRSRSAFFSICSWIPR